MKYILQKKPQSLKSEFPIKNEFSETVLKVEASRFSIRKRISIRDQYAIEIGHIRRKLLSAYTYEIYHEKVRQAIFKKGRWFFKKRYVMKDESGAKYYISGNFGEYRYRIKKGRKNVAVVSPDLSPRSETYGIKIKDPGSPYLCICAALIIDATNKIKPPPVSESEN